MTFPFVDVFGVFNTVYSRGSSLMTHNKDLVKELKRLNVIDRKTTTYHLTPRGLTAWKHIIKGYKYETLELLKEQCLTEIEIYGLLFSGLQITDPKELNYELHRMSKEGLIEGAYSITDKGREELKTYEKIRTGQWEYV